MLHGTPFDLGMDPQSARIAGAPQPPATMMERSDFAPIFKLGEKGEVDVFFGSTPCRVLV